MKLSSCLSGSLLVLLALCGTSCSAPESTAPAASNSGQYYVVSAREAEFYRYGPQQASGPGRETRAGHIGWRSSVRSFGYSEVQLMNGRAGLRRQSGHSRGAAGGGSGGDQSESDCKRNE